MSQKSIFHFIIIFYIIQLNSITQKNFHHISNITIYQKNYCVTLSIQVIIIFFFIQHVANIYV